MEVNIISAFTVTTTTSTELNRLNFNKQLQLDNDEYIIMWKKLTLTRHSTSRYCWRDINLMMQMQIK